MQELVLLTPPFPPGGRWLAKSGRSLADHRPAVHGRAGPCERLDLDANGELRIALISRRGPLSPAAMSFLDGADGIAVKPPYRATL